MVRDFVTLLNFLLHHVCCIFKYSGEKHEIGPKFRKIIEEITQKILGVIVAKDIFQNSLIENHT
jgi:hypothetical protein